MMLTLAATAQKRTLPEPKDTLPTFRGVQVMGDVVGLIMLGVSDYGQYEGGVRVNLKDKYFPLSNWDSARQTIITTSRKPTIRHQLPTEKWASTSTC